ncbi:SH3 domain-containing protein [Eubacterium oxidoreducens]|uniref:SH3 domain-containing protein n=1 Tax=Eubacterium oxidoreducens TaxID=1732 RepID=A0A1G6A039_EUBOX|nr:SH3 domain-containing protein [Eubacterium oxidoreducens]SDB01804.1 SH3 domain-containing protein [Eubacterium oxidoreducens]
MKTNRGTRKVMSTILAASIVCTITIGNADFKAYAEEEDTVSITTEDTTAVEEDLVDSMQEIAQNVQDNTEQEEETTTETTQDKWATRLMADVEDSLNVRAKASKDSEVVGKLYKGSVATILEQGEKWTKIKSGNVTGYVLNKYCVTGDEAKALAKKVCSKVATVTTQTLRVRKKAKESAKVLGLLAEGDKVTVVKKANNKDGWVAIKYEGETAYVSSEYVKVKTKYVKALTVEEEQEKLEQEAAQEAAAQASSSSTTTTQGSSVSASASDAQVLGALIYIEAGASCYEGELAVGAVVMNRVKSSSYPNTIQGVIYQSGQFATGAISSVLASGVPSSCLQAANAAISGQDNTGGLKNFRASYTGHAGINIGDNVFF